jgi:large subunit ribosomal protein L2
MSVKDYKPTTPTRRHTHLEDRSHLSKKKPQKKLTYGKRKKAGRNVNGRITVRRRGGGVKRKIRIIDHKKDKYDVPGEIEALEYDPNISANIALVKYADGERRYIIAPRKIEVGQKIISSDDCEPEVGNTMMLKNIPTGMAVHDVELTKGKGGQLGRSAGSVIRVQGKDPSGKYVQIKMPSGEIRLVPAECRATIGQVGNEEHMNVKIGKAGRKRRMGRRPSVRGTAMHPAQHPHGGGEGKSQAGVGRGGTKDIYGNRIGKRTRKNKKTDKYIIKRRKTKRRPNSKL